MITAGIDCGEKNTKTVIMRAGKILGKGLVLTGFDQKTAIEASVGAACNDAGVAEADLEKIGSTGSGGAEVADAVPVNELKALAKAAQYYFPNSGTVCDVGAEAARVIKMNDKGTLLDFAINDNCAAGAGTFLEAMARALETPLEEMGTLALASSAEIPMNAQCVIFLESEVVGLIHTRIPKQDISKAIHDAMASRIVPMVRRVGVKADVVLMGGVAKNPAFVAALARALHQEKIYIPDDPEYGAAVGTALLVAE